MSLFTQFWLAACFSALLVCPSGAADDDADEGSSPIEKPTVIELTPDNFNELVEESDEYWIVEFFAPWYSAWSLAYDGCSISPCAGADTARSWRQSTRKRPSSSLASLGSALSTRTRTPHSARSSASKAFRRSRPSPTRQLSTRTRRSLGGRLLSTRCPPPASLPRP